MQKTLKTITIDQKDYHYIDYGDKSTSVDGFILKIDDIARDQISTLGGFYRDLLKPVKTNSQIDRLVVLTITTRGLSHLTHFFFDGSDEPVGYTREKRIAQYLGQRLQEMNLNISLINSLDYLKESGTTDQLRVLQQHVSPKHTNDTGLYIGDQMINYGDTLYVTDMTRFYDKLNITSGFYIDCQPDSLELKLDANGEGGFEICGSILIKKDAQYLSTIEGYYYSEKEYQDKPLEQFIEKLERDSLESAAYRLNERFGNRMSTLTAEWIQARIRDANNRLDRYRAENNEPYIDILSMSLLHALLKHNLVQFEKPGEPS